jgi:limonene-1,2-epoxide hydrolase
MLDPTEVVDAFIAAIEDMDLDRACGLLAENVSYENVPMLPIVGRAATHAVLTGIMSKSTRVEWVVTRQLGVGNVVVNERIDRFEIGSGWLELPVAGVFEVNDSGLITLWRDYFDLDSYVRQMAALTTT